MCLPGDPRGSLEWAQTAAVVADVYVKPHPPHRVLARSYEGNAHRALGDLARAQTLLSQARELMEELQISDLDVHAELQSLFGSLTSDLNRFDEATAHLDSAIALFQALGEEEGVARVLIQLGSLHSKMGEFADALEAAKRAVSLLSPQGDVRLYLLDRFNYARHLADAGFAQAARDHLAYDRDLHRAHSDPQLETQIGWLQADLAAEAGDTEGAEEGYLALLQRFVEQGHSYKAARVSRELAGLHHRERRSRELR